MNIFSTPGVTHSGPLPAEVFETLAEGSHCRIERIVSEGHTSPVHEWYDQDQSEWVLLLQGSARLEFEDQTLELAPGDYVNIPAHLKHRVVWTAPNQRTIWLAVFYG
jgi:cupin 2 domain-containing protein